MLTCLNDCIKEDIMAIHHILLWILFSTFVISCLGNENDNNKHVPSNFDLESGNQQSLKSITLYKYPQFREVSPCSCDVTRNKCDIGCCCDSSCQEENNVNITCIPGKIYIQDPSIHMVNIIDRQISYLHNTLKNQD